MVSRQSLHADLCVSLHALSAPPNLWKRTSTSRDPGCLLNTVAADGLEASTAAGVLVTLFPAKRDAGSDERQSYVVAVMRV